MEETPQSAPPPTPKPKLSKEERSRIMKEAATRRWERAKKVKAKAAKAPQPPAKAALAKKQPAAPREFSVALKTAEGRLAKAILERAEAANKYAVLSAEIPNLQRLIVALRNPLGILPEYGVNQQPTLEQIVSGAPIQYQNPARPVPQPVPVIPVPQQLHPVNTQGRAGGGAIGLELQEEEENENKFLDESGLAGGTWH